MTHTGGPSPLLVLGLGNVLCGDDGLGIAALRTLGERFEVGSDVRLVDGGTLGLSLLPVFEGFDDVLLIDAIRVDAPPGSLVRLEGDDVAPAVRERLSVHQVGVADLLDSLRLLDVYPRRVILLGLVPATLELGLERSAAVEAALPRLVAAVVEELRSRGHPVVKRGGDESELAALGGRDVARTLGL